MKENKIENKLAPSKQIVVRFGPSPTGLFHIGGVRTALYNYLLAKQNGGKFLLRIEDTDSERFVPEAEAYFEKALKWLGIDADESPWNPGPIGIYRQSERNKAGLYNKYVEGLLASGDAYWCFDTTDKLDTLRASGMSYNSLTRDNMSNSLTLSKERVQELLESGIPKILRFKVPAGQTVTIQDEIRGVVRVDTNTLDDKVLLKSDGMPTYHLANIADDIEFGVTHVIRGEEWLPSAPFHALVWDAFGRIFGNIERPVWAHLPLLLNPDGKGKLSKRKADQLGFPVFPLSGTCTIEGKDWTCSGYKEAGFLPESLINFLALQGWNPGGDLEIMSMDELIEKFSLSRCSKSGARFSYEKALWFNKQYLNKLSDTELANLLPIRFDNIDFAVNQVRSSCSTINEIVDKLAPYMKRPEADLKKVNAAWNPDLAHEIEHALVNADWTNHGTLADCLRDLLESNKKEVMSLLRAIMTGGNPGAGLFEMMWIIGRTQTIARLGMTRTEIVKEAV